MQKQEYLPDEKGCFVIRHPVTLLFKPKKMGIGEVIAFFWTINDKSTLQGLRETVDCICDCAD